MSQLANKTDIVSHDVNALREKAVLLGWVAGILILISLLWILTSPLQAQNLMRTVNSVFISNNDSRRLYSYLNVKHKKADLLGYWFLMNNFTDRMFVFTVFQDGILIPLGAVVSDNGEVKEIMPLSAHAVKAAGRLPESILKIYIKRIQDAAAGLFGGKV